jgi:hypothetical protein
MPKIQTVAEIEQAYPDEWVLIEITREAKERRRARGRLIAHSRNRADLDEPYQRFRADHPDTLVSEFFTGGDRIPEGVVVVL